MTRRPLLAVLLLTAVVTAGCSLVQPSVVAIVAPELVCDPVRMDPAPTLECEAALQAAIEQVSQEGSVATASFHYGSPCGPNMRCAFVNGNVGYVVVRLVDGRCGYVELAAGPEAISPPRIAVSELAAWPPEDWLGMGVPLDLACQ